MGEPIKTFYYCHDGNPDSFSDEFGRDRRFKYLEWALKRDGFEIPDDYVVLSRKPDWEENRQTIGWKIRFQNVRQIVKMVKPFLLDEDSEARLDIYRPYKGATHFVAHAQEADGKENMYLVIPTDMFGKALLTDEKVSEWYKNMIWC